MAEIKITIEQLESLFQQQKEKVVEAIASNTYIYNTLSTDGHIKVIENIDKNKMREVGMKAAFPNDYNVLKKYIQ